MIKRVMNCLSERAQEQLSSIRYVDSDCVELEFDFVEDGDVDAAVVSIADNGSCWCEFRQDTMLSSDNIVLLMEVIHDLKGEFKKC